MPREFIFPLVDTEKTRLAPRVRIVARAGRSVTLQLSDAASPFAGAKPDGVVAATVFSYAGERPPADLGAWRFECSTSRTTFSVTFDGGAADPAAAVWLTAHWFNADAEPGPACAPIAAHLPLDDAEALPPHRLAA